MASEEIQPLRARESVLVPISAIHRERKAWHTRVHVCEQYVRRLMQAIGSTQEVVPIRVICRKDGTYDYVAGLLRLLAAERLGHKSIPAYVGDDADEELLLRTAFLEQEARFPLKTMERGWALIRLQNLRRERGLPHVQAELAAAVGLDTGDISTALRVGRAIPENRADELAREHRIEIGAITTLGRRPLRRIARADEEESRHLLNVACSALAAGATTAQAGRKVLDACAREHGSPKTSFRLLQKLARRIRHVFSRLAGALMRFRDFIGSERLARG